MATHYDEAAHNDQSLGSLAEFDSQAVQDALASSSLYRLQPILVDSKYRAMNVADWKTVLAATTDAYKHYRPEYFDCDDFARCQAALVSLKFNVNGCGQVYDESGEHSYNVILVSEDGKSVHTRIVEPQAGAILDPDQVGTGHYAETQGFVVI